MKCYVYVVKLIEANIAKMLGDTRWNARMSLTRALE